MLGMLGRSEEPETVRGLRAALRDGDGRVREAAALGLASAEDFGAFTREPVGTLPPPPLIDRVLAPFQRFAQTESASGLVLLACTVIALVWTNSRWAASYTHLWEMPLTVGLGPAGGTFDS